MHRFAPVLAAAAFGAMTLFSGSALAATATPAAAGNQAVVLKDWDTDDASTANYVWAVTQQPEKRVVLLQPEKRVVLLQPERKMVLLQPEKNMVLLQPDKQWTIKWQKLERRGPQMQRWIQLMELYG
ncbi:hypothetical protein ETD86_25585 [Nonomuraea turkmeniaca]|uniref:Uncharacterized protein n=1 Tax=Nonomuraea turkmeniaca TaxID=103838 RepID=A0A5S4FXZ2_9ACTN|nr:hypothetical protein [Nonomuraea turkmeniaca]TMR16290.1 hypothetical protein ETD86_25585 [Nonomuraea turkmeniaca]